MPRIEEPSVIFAVRVPKSLHDAVRMHCAESGVEAKEFIIRALEERLAKVTGRALPEPRPGHR